MAIPTGDLAALLNEARLVDYKIQIVDLWKAPPKRPTVQDIQHDVAKLRSVSKQAAALIIKRRAQWVNAYPDRFYLRRHGEQYPQWP